MKVYNFDIDGFYTDTSEAFKDPLESENKGKDIWLLPAQATFKEVLPKKDGKLIRFINGEWVYEDIPKKNVEEEKPIPLDELRENIKLQINAKAHQVIENKYPDWKQRNMLADVTNIQNSIISSLQKGEEYPISDEEKQILKDGLIARTWIKKIVDISNELVDKLPYTNRKYLEEYDIDNETDWQ